MRAALLLSLVFAGTACRKEPTFVVRFDPIDQAPSVAAPVASQAGPGVDRAVAGAPSAAPTAAASDGGAGRASDVPVARKANDCKRASDCVLVPLDCCGCNQGGRQTAIARAKRQEHAAAQARCKDQMCMQMLSNDPSCSMAAGCVEGRCALVNAAATGAK